MNSIWTKDLFDYKAVKIIVAIAVTVYVIFSVFDYFSVERKCERYVNSLTDVLMGSRSNALSEMERSYVTKDAIKTCVERGGP